MKTVNFDILSFEKYEENKDSVCKQNIFSRKRIADNLQLEYLNWKRRYTRSLQKILKQILFGWR